ncbi:hypothetical protein [Kingella potus]|nr:hypothetical protein [Kingella potus]
MGYAYLAAHKEELLKRDLDDKTAWYEFGTAARASKAQTKKKPF